jgi:hypothetical protein
MTTVATDSIPAKDNVGKEAERNIRMAAAQAQEARVALDAVGDDLCAAALALPAGDDDEDALQQVDALGQHANELAVAAAVLQRDIAALIGHPPDTSGDDTNDDE